MSAPAAPATAARFDGRIADYARHRPGYPPALADWMHGEAGVAAGVPAADVGAGTGIASRLLLDAGHPVIAVEPNAGMRAAALERLGHRPGFRIVDGTAEATSLAGASVGVVVAAQAFHWFDRAAVRVEWARILRPGAPALVVWNTPRLDASPFMAGYEALLRAFGTDYAGVAGRHPGDDAMRAWFGPGWRGAVVLANAQRLDFDALRGRLLSSSYAPLAGDPRHLPMLAALRRLFDDHARDGAVDFVYRTRAFAGTLH